MSNRPHWKAIATAAQLAVQDRDIDVERMGQCLEAESDAVRALTLKNAERQEAARVALSKLDKEASRYLISAIIGWVLFVGTLAAYARVVFR